MLAAYCEEHHALLPVTAAEKQLGPKFDIRAFHDPVLMKGALPLSVLEARVQAWAAR
jgi:uncharacterized protein (DUF885 family)